MNIRPRSASAITFDELKNKVEEIHDFGNDWGLFVDIETNYHNHFPEQKINRTNYPLYQIIEEDEENLDNVKKNNYFKNTKLFLTKLLFYLSFVLGFTFIFDNKK